MNVNDVATELVPVPTEEKDMLDLIFERQHELAKKYFPIEESNQLLWTPDMPVNIHDKFGQARLKDFFWRVTEELVEAYDAAHEHPEDITHYLEELADALHFLVETYLLSGIDCNFLLTTTPHPYNGGDKLEHFFKEDGSRRILSESESIFEVIGAVGRASNCLKQRPWKISQQLTDEMKYRKLIMPAFMHLMNLFADDGLTAREVFEMYFKKSEVNKFRQRSGY